MRLTAQQQATIKDGVRSLFSAPVEVFLFGSRVDDTAKGGDIDLLIVLPEPVENHALAVARVSARLSILLGGTQSRCAAAVSRCPAAADSPCGAAARVEIVILPLL